MPQRDEAAPTRRVTHVAGSRKWHGLAVGTLLATHAALCWLARPPGIMTGQDDAEYLALGQSLRSGGYNMLFRVDQPLHSQYPPGYPGMLAVWGSVFGDGFSSIVMLSLLCSTLTVALCHAAVRQRFGPGLALTTLAILAVNPSLVGAGGTIATEAPFALLSMATLLLMAGEDRRPWTLALAFSTAILAAHTRSIGIVLIGAVLFCLLLERRWRAATALVLVAGLAVGSWMLWTALAPEQYLGASYVADLRAVTDGGLPGARLVSRAFGSFQYYVTTAIPFALAEPSIGGTLADNVAWLLIGTAGALAGLWAFARNWRVAAFYVILYGGLLVVWAWRISRFAVPLVPVVVPLLLVGWYQIGRRRSKRWANAFAGAIAVALFAGGAARTAGMVSAVQGCHEWEGTPPASCVTPSQASFFAALDYIRERVPEDAVFLIAKSGALWAYTGRLSVSSGDARAQEPEGFLPHLRGQGARWILLTDLAGEFSGIAPLMEANCTSLALEAHFPEWTYLFRVLDEAQDDGGSVACEAVRKYREWAQQAAGVTGTVE